MRKIITFSGVIGALLLGGMAYADTAATAYFPNETHTYPVYQYAQQTVDGTNYAAGAVRDEKIRVATTKYVDTKVDGANTGVQTLNTAANQQDSQTSTNATNITGLESSKQVKPGSDVCASLAADESGCGYIAAAGQADSNDSSNYQWVKIIATAESVAAM